MSDLEAYLEEHASRLTQQSERLFVEEFLYPVLGSRIHDVVPQHPFIDSTGRLRRIDFAYSGGKQRLAFEVNGETYHAEGIIPNQVFDDNLFRQNEILRLGYRLIRFSYTQLQASEWRPVVRQSLRDFLAAEAPELLSEYALVPTPLQDQALQALDFYRETKGWNRGVVVLPTGTGKTVLSALDARRVGGRVLFLVHRLDILKQSIDAYKVVWPEMRVGIMTGEAREDVADCDVLFASKDTLRQPHELSAFARDAFDYVVVDEVHHGQSPTYREILEYFQPKFMVGLTGTPDRTDRKDIFELFDYNKVFESSLAEAIEQGYLVPYTYLGLTDNVDYSTIRFQNQRYRTDDLERLLIIPERNEAIVREYLDKGHGDKAIGFCISIRHAERMAEVFRAHGITAAAVHSQSPDRDKIIASFRNNLLQVVFTVDIFNEGVDFPNVRVLLFLRPTESKTIFLQQLGRGLRLCAGKDRVTVLDFIANYRRANKIRKYLAKDTKIVETQEEGDRRRRKIAYTYSTGCEIVFDTAVEEILDRQDAEDLGITREDLKEAYFALAESLGRKPSRVDLDSSGEYRSGQYVSLFGSWVRFLREVGEYTEASYHYPQGVHLGHILSIVWYFGDVEREGTHFDDEYIRLRGSLGEGRIAGYRRQVKYKLLAAMELGLLTDDRNYPDGTDYVLELTPLGREMLKALRPILEQLDLAFDRDAEGIPSTRMRLTERDYNATIRNFVESGDAGSELVLAVLLRMPAVQQMLRFLYHVGRSSTLARSTIYEQFFQTPFVKQFCDQEGIEEATVEASRHRSPFLLNILDACGIINAERDRVTIRKLAVLRSLVRPNDREDIAATDQRIEALRLAWPSEADKLNAEDLSILRELFGKEFLTDSFHTNELILVEEDDA